MWDLVPCLDIFLFTYLRDRDDRDLLSMTSFSKCSQHPGPCHAEVRSHELNVILPCELQESNSLSQMPHDLHISRQLHLGVEPRL